MRFLTSWFFPKPWNEKGIKAFTDWVEANGELLTGQPNRQDAAMRTYFAQFRDAQDYMGVNRDRVAKFLGVPTLEWYNFLYPKSQGKLPDGTVVTLDMIVQALRKLAKTGKTSW